MVGCDTVVFLLRLDGGVDGRARGSAVYIDNALATEITVDLFAFRLKNDTHIGVVAPAGGEEQAGGQPEFGIYLPQNLHAGFLAGGRVIGSDDVIDGNGRGVDALAFHGQRRGGSPGTCGCQGDHEVTVIVEGQDVVGSCGQIDSGTGCGGFILIVRTSGNGRNRSLDRYLIRQNPLDGNRGGKVGHSDGCDCVILDVLRRIQHVDENNRGNAEQFEVGINALAEGVAFEVRGIAQLLHGFFVAIGDQGGVCRRIGIGGKVYGSSSEDNLKPSGSLDRGNDAGGLFQNSHAMLIGHSCFAPFIVWMPRIPGLSGRRYKWHLPDS